MKRPPALFLTLALLLLTTHRLPAPIQEVPESPTPAPAQSAKPKAKHVAKPEPKSEASESATNPVRQRPRSKQSRFAGVWIGTISVGILGTTEETLTINSTGTVVNEKNGFGTATHQATCDGTTVRFQAGSLGEIAFAFTPNADGQTAIASANSVFISNPAVSFRKTPNSEVAAESASMPAQSEFPTAKPVPEKPGFVYNPYDPTARRLLDVAGKPSGTKVKDPSTGKFFIVP
jgi:hypothetical protein